MGTTSVVLCALVFKTNTNMRMRWIAWRAMGALALALAATGCSAGAPSGDQLLAKSLRDASGMTDAIAFRTEQEPVDVDQAVTGVLTLDEAVRLSLLHSPELQSAMARVRIAQAESKQSRLLPNPVVSIIFRWPEGGGSPDIEADLAADLISLLSRQGRINASDDRLRAASAGALADVLDVVSDTQRRYVAIQTLEEAVAVIEQRLAIVERLLQLARDRLSLGEGTQLDVLTLQSQRADLQTDLAERKLELREQRLSLARLLGQPMHPADWRLSPWAPYRAALPPETTWIELGMTHRPEVQARRYQLAALGADVDLTKWAPFDGTEVGAKAERDSGNWSIGPLVLLPIPLFDLGQAKRDRAQAAQAEARHELTRVQRQVVEETRQAYAAFEITRDNLARVRGELIPLLEQRLEQAEAQFKAGQIDITALLIAEVETREGQTRLVELERRNSEAMIRLQRATGGPGRTPTTAPATQPIHATTQEVNR